MEQEQELAREWRGGEGKSGRWHPFPRGSTWNFEVGDFLLLRGTPSFQRQTPLSTGCFDLGKSTSDLPWWPSSKNGPLSQRPIVSNTEHPAKFRYSADAS